MENTFPLSACQPLLTGTGTPFKGSQSAQREADGTATSAQADGHCTPRNLINLAVCAPCQPLAANEDNFPKRSIQLHSHFPFWLFQI